MTASERKIRFNIALEIVLKVYNDYCHDQRNTREQTYEFCCFVQDMMKFANTLGKETKEG